MHLCPLPTLLYLPSSIIQNEHGEIAKKTTYSIRTYITNMLNAYCIKNPNYKEYKCKCLAKINQLDFVTGQQFYSILRYLIQTYITNYM